MGAEAVVELLTRVDLDNIKYQLQLELAQAKDDQKIKDFSNSLKFVKKIRKS